MKYMEQFYEKVLSKDCVEVSLLEFKSIFDDMVENSAFSRMETYIIHNIFDLGKTVTYIMCQMGYKNANSVYKHLNFACKKIRKEINYKYCTPNDNLSLLIGNDLLKKAEMRDCRIGKAMNIFSDIEYQYKNLEEEAIAFIILTKFPYNANLFNMNRLAEREHIVHTFNLLYESQKDLIYSQPLLAYSFVSNLNKAIANLFWWDKTIAKNALHYYKTPESIKTLDVDINLLTKLIYDPECLFSRKYFDYKELDECPVNYIYAVLPYTIIVKLLSNGIKTVDELLIFYLKDKHSDSPILSKKDNIVLDKLLQKLNDSDLGINDKYYIMESYMCHFKELL